MGRAERRAALRDRRTHGPRNGCVFESEPDAADPAYAWLNIRLPAPGMPTAQYEGDAAAERLARFVAGFTGGQADALMAGRSLIGGELKQLDALVADATVYHDRPVALVVRRWTIVLELRASFGDTPRWRLSLQLTPRGSGSRDAHWADFGAILSALAARTGGPATPPACASVETDPNAPHLFSWELSRGGN